MLLGVGVLPSLVFAIWFPAYWEPRGRLGVVSDALHFPLKDMQAAFRAGMDSCLHPQPVERPLQRGAFLLGPQTLDLPVPADPEEGGEWSLTLLSTTFPSPHRLLGPVPADAHVFPLFRNQQEKKDLPLIPVLPIDTSFLFFIVS